MKPENKALAGVLLTLLAVALSTNAHAAATPTFYIRSDKPSYLPGDAGTLLITIRNQGTQAFTVKNITITYSWNAFINDHWEGNETINGINQALAQGQAYNSPRGFTVPNDGRAGFGLASVSLKVGTDIGGGGGQYEFASGSISIASASYQPLGLSSSALELVTIALLAVAVVLLALLLMSIRKTAKKQ